MITQVDTHDGNMYCKEHSFDLISTLASLNITHAERMLSYDYGTHGKGNTILYNTDPGSGDYVDENIYPGLEPLVKITESRYMQRDNSYLEPSNEDGEDYIYHRGEFTDGEVVPTNDADDNSFIYTLANFCSFKLNVYNSFMNQQVVRTTGMIDVNSPEAGMYKIYGGDCHLSLYGVTRYWTDDSNKYPAPNDANGKKKFWYYLYPCFSVSNIGLQHKGKEVDEITFPYFNLIDDVLGRGSSFRGEGAGTAYDSDGLPIVADGSKSLWSKIREANAGTVVYPKDLEQWIGYNQDYNSVNDVEAILPIFDPSIDDVYKFPYRLAGSLILPSGGQFIGWRVFPVNSYIEMPKDKGIGWNVLTSGSDLLVSMKYSLFVFKRKSTLDINDTEVVALGSANLFETKPDEVMATEEGYVGNQCQFASPSSLNGILFIDKERGKVFLYKDGNAREISALGMTNWFDLNIRYNTTDALISDDDEFNEDNPFTQKGIYAVWDKNTERYIITKKANITFTISYSPNLNYMEKIGNVGGWVSFHNYIPNSLFELNGNLYSIKYYFDGETEVLYDVIFKHNGSKGYFYGAYYDTKIDPVVSSPENIDKLFDSFQWATSVRDTNGNPISGDETFSKIAIIYNNRHSSLINLVKGGFGTGNVRETGGEWHFSEFRDILKDKTLELIKDQNIDELLYETIPTIKQYTSSEWHLKSMFICPFVIVRLVFTNIDNKSLMIHDFSVNATPRKRL